MIKRTLFLLIAALLTVAALMIWTCGKGEVAGEQTTVTLELEVRETETSISHEGSGELQALQLVPGVVNAIRFTITGPGMGDINRSVSVSPGQFVSETFEVPNGPDRTFLIEAMDMEAAQLYFKGSTTVDLNGEPVKVPITMTGAALATSYRYDVGGEDYHEVMLAYYDDPGASTISVEASGPGIVNTIPLVFGDVIGNYWRTAVVYFDYMLPPPEPPLVYTFTITETTGTRTETDSMTCFMDYAIPTAPIGVQTLNPPQTYIWNTIGYSGVAYQVLLYTSPTWTSELVIDASSVAYTNTTPLDSGFYTYNVYAFRLDNECTSAYQEYFEIP